MRFAAYQSRWLRRLIVGEAHSSKVWNSPILEAPELDLVVFFWPCLEGWREPIFLKFRVLVEFQLRKTAQNRRVCAKKA
ncbi:hypothetical protein M2323_004236 [Rhodoblastus acidophilus]|uniref:hypothetical protein n=1 Tax=Rhodoblastus acidophilus TaxID=1074 RepID=UPI0022256ED3|nr:hypothetical protein [Rhodoblastus acidophilus]MCW2286441.1 hypothetical protein [Rhodoblastus acidophilus]MCW2335290.1 hypothetical protein [Rhodoblastus acidophilus]